MWLIAILNKTRFDFRKTDLISSFSAEFVLDYLAAIVWASIISFRFLVLILLNYELYSPLRMFVHEVSQSLGKSYIENPR
jgi:hypothetical protein